MYCFNSLSFQADIDKKAHIDRVICGCCSAGCVFALCVVHMVCTDWSRLHAFKDTLGFNVGHCYGHLTIFYVPVGSSFYCGCEEAAGSVSASSKQIVRGRASS